MTYNLRDDLVAAIEAAWTGPQPDPDALNAAVTTALDSCLGRRVRNLLMDERDVKAEVASIVDAADRMDICGTNAKGAAVLREFTSIHRGACPEVLAAARAS